MACSEGTATIEPRLAPPPIDPRLEALFQGELALDVAANARQNIDPLALARQAGTPPTCADFVFLFSWRTRDEKPVAFVGNRQGGEFDVAQGAKGEASVGGCILLQAANASSGPLQGELRYIIAQTRQ
jgi:hypothetical protein